MRFQQRQSDLFRLCEARRREDHQDRAQKSGRATDHANLSARPKSGAPCCSRWLLVRRSSSCAVIAAELCFCWMRRVVVLLRDDREVATLRQAGTDSLAKQQQQLSKALQAASYLGTATSIGSIARHSTAHQIASSCSPTHSCCCHAIDTSSLQTMAEPWTQPTIHTPNLSTGSLRNAPARIRRSTSLYLSASHQRQTSQVYKLSWLL